MIRLLIYLGLIYLSYKGVKALILKHLSQGRVSGQGREGIDDIMVKDPYCEIYFPRREGVHLKINGQDLYFCSTQCRDNYLEQHTRK